MANLTSSEIGYDKLTEVGRFGLCCHGNLVYAHSEFKFVIYISFYLKEF